VQTNCTAEFHASDSVQTNCTAERHASDSVQTNCTAALHSSDSVQTNCTAELHISDSVQTNCTAELHASDSVQTNCTAERHASDSAQTNCTAALHTSDSIQTNCMVERDECAQTNCTSHSQSRQCPDQFHGPHSLTYHIQWIPEAPPLEVKLKLPSTGEIKNTWSNASTFPYAITVQCLIRHANNSMVTFTSSFKRLTILYQLSMLGEGRLPIAVGTYNGFDVPRNRTRTPETLYRGSS